MRRRKVSDKGGGIGAGKATRAEDGQALSFCQSFVVVVVVGWVQVVMGERNVLLLGRLKKQEVDGGWN